MSAPAYEPAQVGPYRILRPLGAGGMGAVYLGQHETTGGHAAIKLIRPEHAANAEFRARLRHEVAAASRVPRFCTAPVLASDLTARIPWVATEYVDAPTLDVVLLEHGRLTGANLEAFAAGVAVALRAIHQHGVIHRDLKPSNILITPFGPRVIDFGIARLEGSETQLTGTGAAVGTPAYMAPEQVRGGPLTAAVDVFAWAGLVTYAATGRPPFGTGEAALPAIVHQPPAAGDLPPSLRDAVAAAFHKDPALRPSAAELVDRLSGTASAATAQVLATAAAIPRAQPGFPAGRPASPGPPRTRPRWRWAAVAAAAVAIAVLGTVTAVVAPGWRSGDTLPPDTTLDGAAAPPFGTETGRPLAGTSTVTAVAVGELDRTPIAVAASGAESTLQVWDLATREPIGEPMTGHTGLVTTIAIGELDGDPIAVSAAFLGDDAVFVWDLATQRLAGTLGGEAWPVTAVALGTRGGNPVVVTGDSVGAVQVVDVRTRRPIGEPMTGHPGVATPVTAIAAGELGDGTPVAVSASSDTVWAWNLDTRQPLGGPMTGPGGEIKSLAVGELDGTAIAVSAGGLDETVRVWDLRAGRQLGEPLRGHTGTIDTAVGAVNSVAVGELDGTAIAVSASDDETLRAWNLDTHRPLGEPFTGHTGRVNAVTMGQVNGVPVAVSGSQDNTVRIWSLADPDRAG